MLASSQPVETNDFKSLLPFFEGSLPQKMVPSGLCEVGEDLFIHSTGNPVQEDSAFFQHSMGCEGCTQCREAMVRVALKLQYILEAQ